MTLFNKLAMNPLINNRHVNIIVFDHPKYLEHIVLYPAQV